LIIVQANNTRGGTNYQFKWVIVPGINYSSQQVTII